MLQMHPELEEGAGPQDSSENLPRSLVLRQTSEFVGAGGQLFPATLQFLRCSSYNVITLLEELSRTRA